MMSPDIADRLDRLPPYKFAEFERIIEEKKAQGIDVISLGIGDPDHPTFRHIVKAGQEALANPEHQQYPSNRGLPEFRQAMQIYYGGYFAADLDPDTEIVPALGAKEAIHHLNLAFVNEGDVVLAADPGYPVYQTGPIMAGGEAYSMPLLVERGFTPNLDAIPRDIRERAKLMFLNYPNNPTGALAPPGFFEEVVDFADRHDILVVHDNAYSETVPPEKAVSFLETPGAKEVGVEVYSFSKGYNMTGWRAGAVVGNAEAVKAYLKLKTNIDSGMFEGVQVAAIEAMRQSVSGQQIARMQEIYGRRRELVVNGLREIGVDAPMPEGTIYVWAPIPRGFETSEQFSTHVLDNADVVVSPGSMYGPGGEGFFRISLTVPDKQLEEAIRRIGALGNVAA